MYFVRKGLLVYMAEYLTGKVGFTLSYRGIRRTAGCENCV